MVVVGLALDHCVKATALDVVVAGWPTIVLEAATRPVNLEPEDGTLALQELVAAGVSLA